MTESFEPVGDETEDLRGLDEEHPEQRVRIARVNLLPGEVLVVRRQRRVALVSLGILAAFLVGLAAVYALQVASVNDAIAARDEVAAEVAVLQTEADSLQEYQVLLDVVQNRETLLTSAMEGELSWARILGDLALSFDRQASLTAIQAASTAGDAAVTEDSAPVTVDDEVFDLGDPVAQVDFTGYSVDRFAPGVEEVLAKFERAEGFDDPYLATAGDEERGSDTVTVFNGLVQLTERAYTHRYDDGLPEESVQ